MGRKSKEKPRKDNPVKRRAWVKELYPYFRDNGVKGITMDKVAELLGKSKSTVYVYFRTKDEIMAEVVGFKLEALIGFEEIIRDTTLPHKERYIKMMEYIIPIISDISDILLHDLKILFPKIWKAVDAFYDHASSVLEDFYRDGINKKIFHHFDPVILTKQDRFFFDEILDPGFLKNSGISPRKAFEDYFLLKFSGLMR